MSLLVPSNPLGHGDHGSGLETQEIHASLLPGAVIELMMEAKGTVQIVGTERCGYCKLTGGQLNLVLSSSVQYVAYYWFTKLSPLEDGRFGVQTVELIAVKTSGQNASRAMSAMAAELAGQNSSDAIEMGPSRINGKWDMETVRITHRKDNDQ